MTDDFGSMEVLGLDELEARLSGMSNAAAGKALFGAMNFALTPIVKEAKERALVADEPHAMVIKGNNRKVEIKPGLLASSIRKRRLPKGEHKGEFAQGAVMGVYVGKGKKQKFYPQYWHFVEYGTSKMAATPFLRPAFDNNIDLVIERFSQKLEKNIDKYTEGGS